MTITVLKQNSLDDLYKTPPPLSSRIKDSLRGQKKGCGTHKAQEAPPFPEIPKATVRGKEQTGVGFWVMQLPVSHSYKELWKLIGSPSWIGWNFFFGLSVPPL